MAKPLPPGTLERMLATGELAKLAVGCKNESELARKLGITGDAYQSTRQRWRRKGRRFPSFEELQSKEFDDEPTNPQAKRWACLEAFDREEAGPDPAGGDAAAEVALESKPSVDVPVSPLPPGHYVKGVSSLVAPDGTLIQQWVKTAVEQQDRLDALMAAFADIAAPFRGLAEPVAVPHFADADLLAVYPLGDPHLGLYAWSEETGNSFDLDIAERNLCGAMDHLVALAPPAREALVVNLGDFFHSDTNANRTARSGNALDVDTRWAKVLRVGIRAMRRLIDRALEKHEVVKVVCAIGNHDDHSSVFLSLALSQFYEREPRVQIDTTPSKFHWHRFGKCLLGITHGDTVKNQNLPAVMATDRAKDWGETEFRHFYTGHVHHDTLKEYPGVTVETFRTLAARDAWHHAAGYRSQRDAKLDVWHRRWGLIQRHCVGINQICSEAA